MAGAYPQRSAGGQAHLLQPLSPVQIIVTVRGVIGLGGDAVQGPFQSCGKKGGHLSGVIPPGYTERAPQSQEPCGSWKITEAF